MQTQGYIIMLEGATGMRDRKITLPKRIAAYALTLLLSYWFAWTLAFLFINGTDFGYYVTYWVYAVEGGGEHAVFTLGYSVIFFLPIAALSSFLVHRRLEKACEERASR